MFDLQKAYGYDKKLADQGAKYMLGADPEEYIQLRRSMNPDYKALLNKEYRAAELSLKNPDLEVQNKISDAILSRVVAKTLVVGWGKKFGVNGKVLPFTVDNAIQIFNVFPEFRQACQVWAENNANFQEPEEVSVENVKKS